MFGNPQRVAWITVLTGFVVFCVICTGTIYGVRWFLFDSTVGLQVTASVSQRTIIIASPDDVAPKAVTNETVLNRGERVITDEGAQASVTFHDRDTVLSTVQLMPASRVRLRNTSRPRFGLGENPFIIQLDDALGNLYVTIAPHLEHNIRLEMADANGRRVRLDEAGYYLVTINDDTISVAVRQGQAVLVTDDNRSKLVQVDQTGQIDGTGAINVATNVQFNLIKNSLFEGDPGPDGSLPPNWGCEILRPDNPDETGGDFEYMQFQDRLAMRLVRNGPELGHGETKCSQVLRGIEVADYESLRLRVTMYLSDHDVSACGMEGTECVLMIRLRYYRQFDLENGGQTEGDWIQGFYVYYDPAKGGRTRCGACFNEHQHVNGNTWFTFESGDFVLDLPTDDRNLRPVELIGIEFYSSGHSYDAYVSEVTLIGTDLDEG